MVMEVHLQNHRNSSITSTQTFVPNMIFLKTFIAICQLWNLSPSYKFIRPYLGNKKTKELLFSLNWYLNIVFALTLLLRINSLLGLEHEIVSENIQLETSRSRRHIKNCQLVWIHYDNLASFSLFDYFASMWGR